MVAAGGYAGWLPEFCRRELGTGRGRGPGELRGGKLEQVVWVLVHEEGYLADVPWHHLAHRNARHPAQSECRAQRGEPYLKFSDSGASEAPRQLHCLRCGARESFPSSALPPVPFPADTWQQPWLREPPACTPEGLARPMEINDVRVHSPSIRTALVIPPESRIRRGTVTDRLYGSSASQRTIRSARTRLARKAAIRRLADEYRCPRMRSNSP